MVIARDRGPKPFELGELLSGRIERFLLLVRLLKPGTSESMFEVVGETRPVRQFRPTLGRFRGAGPSGGDPGRDAAGRSAQTPASASVGVSRAARTAG
ncbi:hypothetical protein GA0070624_6768 [Micromonospora rhizosphaerae]|uniref:Uncharacterized protein n=1 Tax=Micromonospora rhizosphaerae TaxID=568872 RepID=A0A1C6TEP3_9ACTN|nr:hypothetical protein GA0070624_6768 [Micromonospora rhizosphaerae]